MQKNITPYLKPIALLLLLVFASPVLADQTIIDEDFSDISNWNDLSKAVTWGGQSSAVSAFTTSGGSVTMTSDAGNYAGYNNEDQLLTFTSLDYQFPSPVDHNTSTIEIDFRAKWSGGSASGEGSRFNIIVNHAYPVGGLDMDLDDKYDDLEAQWWARPAYQVRMRGPIHSTILQYGGGTDIDGEYEIYNNQWWLPGFIAAPGGGSPNDGVPGCVTTGSGNSLYTTSWADYKYVIKPDRQEIWMNGTLRATQMLDSDPGNPDYFNYFNTLEGVRLYWRGASASQIELDHMTITVLGGSANPPSAPGNLLATSAGTDQIDLTWDDNASTEDGFKIERKQGTGSFMEIATVGVDVTSYSDTGLADGTTFTYRVRAYNADGHSTYSNESSATTDALPNPPAGPSNLVATTMGTDAIDLTWIDNSDNEDGFRIERKEGLGSFVEMAMLGSNIESYGDTGLNPASTYTYRVVAYNADGDSPWSNEASATTNALPNPPAAPTDLVATSAGTEQIDLTWTDNADNETGFKIERKTGADAFAEIATVGANVVSYSNTGLTASTTCTYRVVAFNGDGNSNYSNEASATTLEAPTVPAAPSALAASAVSDSQINLTWSDNSDDETGFKIERKSGSEPFSQIATVGDNVTSYANTGLPASTIFTYRVRAANAVGDSPWSNEASATTQYPAQTPFAGSPIPIPGRIEAEDYDNGGEGIAYHDADASNNGGKYRSDGVDIESTSDVGGGYNVGWIQSGEWLEYTVDVAEDGDYNFDVRVASSSAGGTLHIECDGTDVGPISFPATGGWQNWITVSKNNVALTAGQKIMRLYMQTSSFNVNYVDIQPAGGSGGIGIFADNADIGAVGYAGSAGESGGDYTIEGSGKDIWNKADEFHYAYNAHSGDGEIIAKVTSVQNTNTWAKAGVMFRDGTAANAKMAMVIQRPDKQVCFQWRTSTGGSASWNGSLKGGKTNVKWVRLVRSGNNFEAYYSTSSGSGPWTKIGNTVSISMSDVKAGLCVTSHNNSSLCTATFTDVTLNSGSIAKGLVVEEQEENVETVEIPQNYALAQNYPNPFNPQTTLSFSLPKDEYVTLEIYDIRGTRVRQLAKGQRTAGVHTVVWDATDEFGAPVSTGLYVYHITAGDFSMTRKMTFVK